MTGRGSGATVRLPSSSTKPPAACCWSAPQSPSQFAAAGALSELPQRAGWPQPFRHRIGKTGASSSWASSPALAKPPCPASPLRAAWQCRRRSTSQSMRVIGSSCGVGLFRRPPTLPLRAGIARRQVPSSLKIFLLCQAAGSRAARYRRGPCDWQTERHSRRQLVGAGGRLGTEAHRRPPGNSFWVLACSAVSALP